MNKIQIVNWLLTRRCNLRCEYCRLIRNYKNKPLIYPDITYYSKYEMRTNNITYGLERLKKHNPDCFMIFYGGEPTLRDDLYQIVNYCNENDIHYTIISNNINEKKTEELLSKVDYVQGYTASIDPIIYISGQNSDIAKKSIQGIQKLTELKDKIRDVVAEITVTNDNLVYLYPLVKELTNRGINSDITFVDIAKSEFYDFSNIENRDILVQQTKELKEIIDRIISEKLNVHMRETLLPMIYENLPSQFDCGLDRDFHDMCVDADGSLRLCLRIRGLVMPYRYNVHSILNDDGTINSEINKFVKMDKDSYCKGCNHSCYMMSKMISDNEETSNNLIHSEIRKS